MDRAEATGLGVATAGHVALLAALTYGVATTQLPESKSDPIEVAFVEEVGLESTSPTPTAVEPAPLAGPENGPPVPAMPAPPEVEQIPAPPQQPQPQPQPQPRAVAPKPAPAPKPQPKSPPRKASEAPPKQAAPKRNASGLNRIVDGLSDRANPSQSTAAPAAAADARVQASLGAEVRRQLKPHWKAPTGADAEQLRTEVIIALAQDGRVTDIRIAGTTGQTASNRPQVPIHREHAERAVRLAAPFKLPAQYYDAWKSLRVTFDKRLSQ